MKKRWEEKRGRELERGTPHRRVGEDFILPSKKTKTNPGRDLRSGSKRSRRVLRRDGRVDTRSRGEFRIKILNTDVSIRPISLSTRVRKFKGRFIMPSAGGRSAR